MDKDAHDSTDQSAPIEEFIRAGAGSTDLVSYDHIVEAFKKSPTKRCDQVCALIGRKRAS